MEAVNQFILLLDSYLGSAAYFPYLLLGTGLFFTIILKFPQIRFFAEAIRIIRGKRTRKDATGDTSHFQALTTALSGTVGTGNIGGVGFALFLGGPAALFWMWMTAFFGMTTKFVEVTLSHKYRVQTSDGTMAGGPMYFMERKLGLKPLAIVFAIATVICSFGTGNLPQINNIAVGLEATFDIAPIVTGSVLVVPLALVILGGIHRIAKVTEKLVPLMSVVYFFGALAVIIYNIDGLVPAFQSIFAQVFTGSAAVGGFLGASFAYAFSRGVNRGLFSNEAGQGSAPIAHASAKTDEPVAEGMVSILEPFIDTIIICTLTGLAILSSGVWTEKFENTFERSDLQILAGGYSDTVEADRVVLFEHLNGIKSQALFTGDILVENGAPQVGDFTILHARSVAESVVISQNDAPFTGTVQVKGGVIADQTITFSGKSLIHSAALTTAAFKRSYFGEYGGYIVSIGLLLFAFSTAIAWSYYGDRAMIYLFGQKAVLPYRIVFLAGFWFAAFADTSLIWNISAVGIVLMTIPNLLGILLLQKDMRATVNDYLNRMRG